ncbi:ABC transporter ATP-binding protein [Ornithinibacillus gellani]|uniref:ABC transporter ATP-binding protein n=1 Tax=Ornithinibacillus gellani TaxID=2293253 RepID=UPI000F470D59|nr:ABC transporter ATP-binding protein [Ornithinibacillus gellani]TQS70631.1 ABC transporter ATP-binding protein [Ornithinibacillus gellani]
MTILQVNQLTKIYNGHTAVHPLDFSFEANRCIALLGPNGAGKTTTLRMLAGLLAPTSGTIQFTGLNGGTDRRQWIGYLPQYPVFYDWMTGKEFLMHCGQLAFLSKAEADIRSEDLLKRMRLETARNKRISGYSGGMKQRLGIAQAIIHKPKLLLLDEPVSSLDPIGRREILTLLESLKKEMAILFSTHILTDAEEVSDELLLLDRGRLIEAGSMKKLRGKYQTTKIELAFQNDVAHYQEKLQNLPGILEVQINRDMLHVDATDISVARTVILQAAAKENWPLTSFVINRTSLEDMFVKVVDQHATMDHSIS